MGRTQYLDERQFSCNKGKAGGNGKGKSKEDPRKLEAEVRKAEQMAEEARANRAKAAAYVKAQDEAKKAENITSFSGSADSFEFVAETSYMQGRADMQMDRHVMVKDLAKAAKAMKMPLDILDKPLALFSLYDGHLGPKCSEYCAKTFHTKLIPRLTKVSLSREQTVEEQIRAALTSALSELDQEFISKFRTDLSGCSVQIGLMVGRRLYVASLGAARSVLFSGSEGELDLAWSPDALHNLHVPSSAAEQKSVEAAGGTILEIAPGISHVVAADFYEQMKQFRMQQASGMGCAKGPPTSAPFTRSLGDRNFKVPKNVVSCEPEIRTVTLQRNHHALAFVSDGIADVLSDIGICSVLQYNVGNESKSAGELTQKAYTKGSEQNVTAIVVYFRWPSKRKHEQTFGPGLSTAVPPRAELESALKEHPDQLKIAMKAQKRLEASLASEGARKVARDSVYDVANSKEDAKPSLIEAAKANATQSTPHILLFVPVVGRPTFESLHEQRLAVARPLLEDEDGDLAHEFLEEAPILWESALRSLTPIIKTHPVGSYTEVN